MGAAAPEAGGGAVSGVQGATDAADEGGSIELDAGSGTQGDHQVPASFLVVRRNARNNSARKTNFATPDAELIRCAIGALRIPANEP